MEKSMTKELKNKFVIDGELTSFEPKSGQYGNYALIKWNHNNQEFSAMATGDAVDKLKAIIANAGGKSETPSVSLAGFLQMREAKSGKGFFLNLRVIDAKEPTP